VGVFYFGFQYLKTTPRVDRILIIAYSVVITWFLVRLVIRFIALGMEGYADKQAEPEMKRKQIKTLLVIINIIVWSLALILLMGNLGYNVTGIVAGLGIGGIAIALAAQTILGDLFSYFVIFFDKPFEVGDFIIVNDKVGSVEKVGLKSTRIRAISGEQIIISNTNLTDSWIHNYKRMERRRVVLKIGVIYGTPAAKIENIPVMVESMIKEQEELTFDRAHFSGFGDFSLNFEIVYFVGNSDYVTYMNNQQNILLKLYRAFENEGIEFAFPTQTLFLQRSGGEKEEKAPAKSNGVHQPEKSQ
jgi:small-conductance mechanosensitive channel